MTRFSFFVLQIFGFCPYTFPPIRRTNSVNITFFLIYFSFFCFKSISIKSIGNVPNSKMSLHFIFLTDVENLYHICQKALAHIWKSFTTTVKQLKSNNINPIPLDTSFSFKTINIQLNRLISNNNKFLNKSENQMFIFQFLFFYNPFLNTSDIFTEIHTNLIYFLGG